MGGEEEEEAGVIVGLEAAASAGDWKWKSVLGENWSERNVRGSKAPRRTRWRGEDMENGNSQLD